MGDVHDARGRRDADHDGLANGHGVVGRSEVGHEDDGGSRTRRWEGRGSWIIPPRSLRAGGAEQSECEQQQDERTKAWNHYSHLELEEKSIQEGQKESAQIPVSGDGSRWIGFGR